MLRAKFLRFVTFTLSFTLGAVALLLWQSVIAPLFAKPSFARAEVHLGQEQFINPLLDCAENTGVRSPKAAALEEKVQSIIDRMKKNLEVEDVSVYYRDLNNGPIFGINEFAEFAGASLMKVPVMISYLKLAEGNPDLLKNKIVFDPQKHVLQNYSQMLDPPSPLIEGESYDISSLIGKMIIDSDNQASSMLLFDHPEIDIIRVLRDMGVKVVIRNDTAFISVRDYASVFRILYNSTYLPRSLSSAALDILARSKFDDGLLAGVDRGVPVAHKFGERTNEDVNQLHDCGIVYYPGRPYLLCIMTKGRKGFEPLLKTIVEISKVVFQETKSAQN
jgi:beta-lactamase class A